MSERLCGLLFVPFFWSNSQHVCRLIVGLVKPHGDPYIRHIAHTLMLDLYDLYELTHLEAHSVIWFKWRQAKACVKACVSLYAGHPMSLPGSSCHFSFSAVKAEGSLQCRAWGSFPPCSIALTHYIMGLALLWQNPAVVLSLWQLSDGAEALHSGSGTRLAQFHCQDWPLWFTSLVSASHGKLCFSRFLRGGCTHPLKLLATT